jgi:hypothetical protein
MVLGSFNGCEPTIRLHEHITGQEWTKTLRNMEEFEAC